MTLAPSPSRDDYLKAIRAFMLSIVPGIEIVGAQDNRVPEPAGTDYIVFNEVARRRLSTNVTTYADCAFTGSATGSTLTVVAVRLGAIQTGAILLGTGVLAGTAIGAQQSGSTGGIGVYALSQAQQAPIAGVPLATGSALIMQPSEITLQTDVYGPGAADNATTLTTLLRDDYATLWFARQGYAANGIAVLDIGEVRQLAFVDGEDQFEDRYSFDLKLQVNQVTSPSQDFADAISVNIYPPGDNPAT